MRTHGRQHDDKQLPPRRRHAALPAIGAADVRSAAHARLPTIAAMRILIANDDGYLAPGLAALIEACRGLGDIDVVAPEQNASGTSNSLTLNRPLSVYTRAPTASAISTARRPTASTSR